MSCNMPGHWRARSQSPIKLAKLRISKLDPPVDLTDVTRPLRVLPVSLPPMARTSPAKRRVSPEDRAQFRDELIAIARQIYLTEGSAAVTIRRVTATAGVTPMAFYWYFDCKDALLTVLWDELVQESADICLAVAEAAPPDEAAVAYFSAFIDFWLSRRARFRAIFLNEGSPADFQGMRRTLFGMPGALRHFTRYDQLLAQALRSNNAQDPRIEQLRTLSMYRAFGFLHCAVGVYDYDAADTARFRALVIDEMGRCLAHWQAN